MLSFKFHQGIFNSTHANWLIFQLLLFYRFLKPLFTSTKSALSIEMSNRTTYSSNKFHIQEIRQNSSLQSNYATSDSRFSSRAARTSYAAPRAARRCFWHQKQSLTILLVAPWTYGLAAYCYTSWWQVIRHFGAIATRKCYLRLLGVSSA